MAFLVPRETSLQVSQHLGQQKKMMTVRLSAPTSIHHYTLTNRI